MCLEFGVKEQEGKYFLYRTEKVPALNTMLTSWLMESPLIHWGLGKSLGQQSVGLAPMIPQFALHHHITGHNSTCLWSQHLGGRDRRIKRSRSYREIKLEGIWNLPPCWLAFIVPESIIQSAWVGGTGNLNLLWMLQAIQPKCQVKYGRRCNSVIIGMGITNCFLFAFEVHATDPRGQATTGVLLNWGLVPSNCFLNIYYACKYTAVSHTQRSLVSRWKEVMTDTHN